jgi:predicted ferric reductase
MCFWNLPLLWLFAGRNDFLMWITGWSFSSFNLMHRWVARVAVVQAIVHSIGYTWIERDYYATEWADLYWRCGIFATVLMSLLIPLSMLPLRRYYYEIFLVTHILFAAVIIPLLWYHVAIFDGQYAPFLWACIGVWVFDRVLRLIRLKVLSGHSFTGKNAVATLTGNDNGLIRLTVNTPFKIRPQPGQYFFLYNPRSLAPWENHPFTLASWEQEEKSTKLHFLIAVQSGATRRLKRKINPSVPTEMKVLLEGPYGHTEPVERYEHVLFVAGGSGITAMLPYLHSLKNNFCTRTATVVWAVKDNAYASDVLANELRSSGAEIILHVTEEEQPGVATLTRGDQPLNEAAEGSGEKHVPPENKSTSSGSTISFKVGRPTMETLVKTHAGRLVGSERLAIVSCGPAAMMDDMRKAVTDVYGIKEGQVNGSAVDYYEELFSW